MLKRCGKFLYNARWGTLLVCLLMLIGTGIFSLGAFSQLKTGGYSDPTSESSLAKQLLDTKLGGSTPDVILILHSSTLHVNDPAFAQAAEQLLSSLKQHARVTSVISYYSTPSQRFISRDGHETFALLQLSGQDLATKQQEYQTLKPLITSKILQVSAGGNIPVNLAINNQVGSDLERAEIISFPLLAVLLLFVFGGLTAAGLPLLTGGVAILGSLAVLHLLTLVTTVSIYAINVTTMLGLGLAIDYALFIVTRFREELAIDENDVCGSLERTMATAGRTVIFSALTVSTSLLSLLLFPVTFLRSVGLGAIATILVVMLTSLTLLPTILALLGKHINALSWRSLFPRRQQQKRASGKPHNLWYHLSETVMHRPVPVALAVLALLLTLGWPFLHITFATPDEKVLPVGQVTRIVSEQLHQDFAQLGNAQVTIVVKTPGSPLTASNLDNLNSYMKSIEAIPGVEQVESLAALRPALTLAGHQQISPPLACPRQVLYSFHWRRDDPARTACGGANHVRLASATHRLHLFHRGEDMVVRHISSEIRPDPLLAPYINQDVDLAARLADVPLREFAQPGWGATWAIQEAGIDVDSAGLPCQAAISDAWPICSQPDTYVLTQSAQVGAYALNPVINGLIADLHGSQAAGALQQEQLPDRQSRVPLTQKAQQDGQIQMTPDDRNEPSSAPVGQTTQFPASGLKQVKLQPQLFTPAEQNPQITQDTALLVNGDLTKITVALQPSEHSASAVAIVKKIRALHAPGGLIALVDGITPEQIDLLTSLSASVPFALLIIMLSIFVLLFLMTGSLLIPIKAIILNILSLSATFGGLVWIFQDGHLQSLLHFQSTGSIDATQPILIFAIAFGLSMDYEVFLLSRMKECFDETGNNRLAVSAGLQRTGWLITSAALLLAVVLGAFSTARIIFIQEIGIGLAMAVIMDATLIRMLLVPATMCLLGNLNWWAPPPARWLWQQVGLERKQFGDSEGGISQSFLR